MRPGGVLGSADSLRGRRRTGAMRLFLTRSDLAFTLLRAVPEGSWQWRGGVSAADGWKVPQLVSADGNEDAFIPVDCFTLSTGSDGLILSEFGRARLGDLLGSAGEFLEVKVFERSYWWFNCLACTDAIDRRSTDADWGLVEGEWGSFRWITTTRRLGFRTDALQHAPMLFRVPEYPQGALFGRDEFLDAVERHCLTGFQFDLVWTSEGGGALNPPGISFVDVFDEIGEADLARKRAEAVDVLRERSQGCPGD